MDQLNLKKKKSNFELNLIFFKNFNLENSIEQEDLK